jgi:enamine deaminase RidA (YjgF/YER057c/UK114 family)
VSGRVEPVEVPGWPRPRGYANGILGRGRVLHVAGQVGWDAAQRIVGDDLVAQFAAALDNVLAVVRAAGGAPWDLAEMTIYVTDLDAYRAGAAALGAIWRERFGRHYPAMALVGVAGLVEPGAQVEIQAVAYLEDR